MHSDSFLPLYDQKKKEEKVGDWRKEERKERKEKEKIVREHKTREEMSAVNKVFGSVHGV